MTKKRPPPPAGSKRFRLRFAKPVPEDPDQWETSLVIEGVPPHLGPVRAALAQLKARQRQAVVEETEEDLG